LILAKQSETTRLSREIGTKGIGFMTVPNCLVVRWLGVPAITSRQHLPATEIAGDLPEGTRTRNLPLLDDTEMIPTPASVSEWKAHTTARATLNCLTLVDSPETRTTIRPHVVESDEIHPASLPLHLLGEEDPNVLAMIPPLPETDEDHLDRPLHRVCPRHLLALLIEAVPPCLTIHPLSEDISRFGPAEGRRVPGPADEAKSPTKGCPIISLIWITNIHVFRGDSVKIGRRITPTLGSWSMASSPQKSLNRREDEGKEGRMARMGPVGDGMWIHMTK
jgi:hypothetical protein